MAAEPGNCRTAAARPLVASARQIIRQGGAEKTVGRGDRETGATDSSQRQIVKAAANAIADGHRANEDRAGDCDAEERADVAARVEAEVGFDQT